MTPTSTRGSGTTQRARTWAILGAIAALVAGCSSPGTGTASSSTTGAPASATTSSAPSPSLSTTGVATPGHVTVDPVLPAANPLPAGIWAKTTPGWVLATYEPTVVTYDQATGAQTTARTRQVIYLVSPAGARYQVLELGPDRPLEITSWTAGQSVAYVEDCGDNAYCTNNTGPTYALDLTTGALTPVHVPSGADHVEAALAGPVRIWLQTSNVNDPASSQVFLDRNGTFTNLGKGWELPQPSPDGAWIAMDRWDPMPDGTSREVTGVIHVAAGTLASVPAAAASAPCSPYEWTEDNRLVEYCSTADGSENWVTIDPVTLATTPVASPLPAVGAVSVRHDVLVAPGVWAGAYGTEGALMWTDAAGTVGISDHGSPTELTLVDANGTTLKTAGVIAAVGNVAYFSGKLTEVDAAGPQTVVAYDVSTRRQTVLLPTPPGGPATGAGLTANQEAIGVTSWVVAR